MTLQPGNRLGPYEILSALGAGGMGEVYRARDVRLQREVAIKVVPAAIANDATALARFEREAQAVAALSHPNILAIHDIGHEGGTAFAVMELLSGRTLREHLENGPLPLRKALDYGRQITDGLAAAHDRGIVHRDLKPENIFITADGRAKLLDFGLARVQAPISSGGETILAQSDTAPGTILGTIGYMAPEQVRGLAVDARTDIFAFGAVLYEMLAGVRAFSGSSAADTLSAILTADPPDLTPRTGSTPPALDRIVRRALEKEPTQRFQSARDLGFALDAIATGASSSSGAAIAMPQSQPSRRWLPLAAALAVGLLLGAVGWRAFATTAGAPASTGVQRFTIGATEFQVGVEWVAVAPNGRLLAWGGNVSTSSTQSLGVWIRRLDSTAAEPLRGALDLRRCTFMPDSQRLLCTTVVNQLVVLDIESGRRTTVWSGSGDTSGAAAIRNAAVSADGRIAAGINSGIGILENGAMRMVATPADGERGLGYPSWSPDGQHLLFYARQNDGGAAAYIVAAAGGARTPLNLPLDATGPTFTPDGAVIYGQSGVLWAQRLASDWKLDGAPVRLAGDLSMDAGSGFMSAVTSAAGILAFRSPAAGQMQFEWVDRIGRQLRTVGNQDAFANFDVAADGRIATTRREPFMNGNSLWMIDPARGLTTTIGPFEGQSYSDPTFTPDGTKLAFRRGQQLILRTLQGNTEVVLRDFLAYPDSWTRDGRYLTAGRPITGGYDGWILDTQNPAGDMKIVSGMSLVDELRFSPNGKWVAFHAAQKATAEVYVTPFPPTGEHLQISAAGGIQPRWNSTGTELYFLDLAGQLVMAPVPGGDARKAGTPVPLFRTNLAPSSAIDQIAVSHDDKAFLIRRPVTSGSNEAPVQVILNWTALMPPRGK